MRRGVINLIPGQSYAVGPTPSSALRGCPHMADEGVGPAGRRIALTFILALGLLTPSLAAQTRPATRPAIEVRVDPRVELVCIIFRLAGNNEYGRGKIPGYIRDVDERFGPLAGHPVVQLARKLRAERGVSFDAPMSLTVHLTDDFDERVPLVPLPAEVDSRWPAADARRFVKEAKDFAEKAKFGEFLKSHRELYDLTEARMRKTLEDHAHIEWFGQYFGTQSQIRFHVVPGLLNGGSCYGTRFQDGRQQDMYCILGVWDADPAGMPRFPTSVMPTVIHEFGHSHVNPLVNARLADFERSGRKLFARSEQVMRRQAYGQWETVIYESLVRATVVRYRNAHDGPLAAMGEVMEQNTRGFVWTGELSKLLDQYESDRKTYPTFETFMPRIVEFFDEYTSRKP